VIRRVIGSLLVAIVIVGVILYENRSYNGYSATVMLADAGGLENGSNVEINGVTVGRVSGLNLNHADRAVAGVHLTRAAAPLGAGAHATVEIDGFFGERVLDLTRGAYKTHPERSGYTIPVADSGISVRLDDVVDTLDMDAQGALQTFLHEQGVALVGRGHDLNAVLQELPQSLPSLTELLNQLSANQQALGALVDHSDEVVAQVAAQRQNLGKLVNSANGALGALASRRTQLGSTVRTAPGTLQQARATLATLQGAAIPLAPAADGLRETAPSLTTALHQIPAFANAAVPTLNEVARVAPALQTLANEATPVVRAVVPLTTQLVSYSNRALVPLTSMLANKGGAANLFGLMEGWARSTQGYDASSHIFRFGATVTTASFDQLLAMAGLPSLPALHRTSAPKKTSAPNTSAPTSTPAPTSTAPAASLLPPTVTGLGSTIGKTLSGTLGAVGKTVSGILGSATGTSGTSTGSGSGSGLDLPSLLGYLFGR
jgi:phospholipid/cholesterol/gamma-HCH transport system substrate-binding protein